MGYYEENQGLYDMFVTELNLTIMKFNLDSPIKDSLVSKLLEIDKDDLTYKFYRLIYSAPERDYSFEVTNFIFDMGLNPVLLERHVLFPQGCDLWRDIYKVLCGQKEVKYNTKPDTIS
ncbi:hypothetical protein J4230_00150 [Candidatus Woesearchaeota archaeon]|nr:hypothetical protein [Candidatus Woesearchaeota archaeon]